MVFFKKQCHAYAKALHYKEMEFEGAQSMELELVPSMTVETQPQPVSAVEALIHINNQLNQHEVHLILNSGPAFGFSTGIQRVSISYVGFGNVLLDDCMVANCHPVISLQAAMGILTYARSNLRVELKESWCVSFTHVLTFIVMLVQILRFDEC